MVRVTVKSWGAILLLLVVLVAALSTGYGLLFRLTYLLAGVLLLSLLWSLVSLLRLEVSREGMTERTQVGAKVEETLFIANPSRIPRLWLEVRENSDLPQHNASRAMSLSGGARRQWQAQTLCTRRGRFTLGPVTLVSGDPFGLFLSQRVTGDRSPLLVYPAPLELPHFQIPSGELLGGARRRQRTHYVTTNPSGVRDYMPGDSYNRIHWLTTARTGQLMVKDFELDSSSDVWLLLDLEREAHLGWGEDSTEEYAVTIAASLAKHFLGANRAVGLITSGKSLEVLHPDRGDAQLWRILETLALAEAEGRFPLDVLLAGEERHFSRNATLLVITPSTKEAWLHSLHYLMRRGIQVVVVLLEASSFGERESSVLVRGGLNANGIPTYLVRKGEPIAEALALPQLMETGTR